MEIPAYAPTIVSGASKIDLSGRFNDKLSARRNRTGRQKTDNGNIRHNRELQRDHLADGNSCRGDHEKDEDPRERFHNPTSNPTKLASAIPSPDNTNRTSHSAYLMISFLPSFSSFHQVFRSAVPGNCTVHYTAEDRSEAPCRSHQCLRSSHWRSPVPEI